MSVEGGGIFDPVKLVFLTVWFARKLMLQDEKTTISCDTP